MSKIGYMVKRIFSMDLSGLKERIQQVHDISKKSKAGIFFDMALCGVRYGAGYIDYTIFGMYDMTSAERKTVLTRTKNNRYVANLNNREKWDCFENKVKFLKTFSAYAGREFCDLQTASQEEFRQFCHRNEIMIVKPVDGICGKGIEKINVKDFEDYDRLYDILKKNQQLLCEQIIRQHDDINRLYPDAVNTIRLTTMISNDGQPHIVFAAQRLGSGGSVVDNFNSGGMSIPINIDTGVLKGVAVNKLGKPFPCHPNTKVEFDGYQLPFWNECIKLVLNAALVIPDVRYIGWDVAVTPAGPVLIEGNQYPGHDIMQLVAQTPQKIGMLPIYDSIVSYKTLK